MTAQLEHSIVRIRTAAGKTVGAGFLVAERQVLTCAHVVTAALGLPHDAPNPPQADLHLDFPLLAPESTLTARVSHWQCCTEALALDMAETSYHAALVLGIVLLHQGDETSGDAFVDAAARCRIMLDKTPGLYEPHYALAAALVGQSVCDLRWADENQRPELLTPALVEYRRTLDICAAPGIVQDALRNLELIRATGIEGLEPVFELLESALREVQQDDQKEL